MPVSTGRPRLSLDFGKDLRALFPARCLAYRLGCLELALSKDALKTTWTQDDLRFP